ncbi:preprotein translocase subunit SecG [Arcanobacterium wilhelmae]|uniref:preprotein translocase subunit SecG n=1 Tax=Arcanobacterium wilhelmae TaxID=1803177 RepID=UPI00351FBDAB
MNTLLTILTVLLIITSLLLIGAVLLHKGKGGGLSDMFGGGISTSARSSGVAEKNLDRYTIWLSVVWFILIGLIGLIVKVMN